MNFFGIGLPEMAVIFVLALLVFGPKKLPEIGRSLGKTLRSFQQASKDFENEFKREAEQLEKAIAAPMEATLEPLEPAPPKALAANSSETASDSEIATESVAAEPNDSAAEVPSSEEMANSTQQS
jgi:sec-independent protein translocase protein TatA